jgi:xanthine dehydrogenase accessory factor
MDLMMRDILPQMDSWLADGQRVAVATVVQTWGSSPRRAGSRMAVAADGKFSGSVSGGCVENAVIEAALESIKTGHASLLHFGVSDEAAWQVGLACGGSVDIFVKPLDGDFFQKLRSVLMDETQAALITVIRGPDELLGRELLMRDDGSVTGALGSGLDERVLKSARETLSLGTSTSVMLNHTLEVFIEAILPPPTLIAVGGVQIAIALVSLAKTLGYRTIVVDPRGSWGNTERFPQVDQMIQSWPEEAFGRLPLTRSTAVAMLTHDPKLDDPALKIALPSPAFYVGALGSRKTQAARRARLKETGLGEEQLARLHAPIGLEIGADTPEEIALAIMAEIVEARRKQIESAESIPSGVVHKIA